MRNRINDYRQQQLINVIFLINGLFQLSITLYGVKQRRPFAKPLLLLWSAVFLLMIILPLSRMGVLPNVPLLNELSIYLPAISFFMFGILSAMQLEQVRIDLLGSLTWADSKVKRNDQFPASVGQRQIRVPEWRASGAVTWRPDDRWSYTLGARYSGEQFSTLDNTDINGFAYTAASRYFTTDVRVTYRVSPKSTLAFGIDNLNNDQYWAFHPYPQRTFHLEFKTSL